MNTISSISSASADQSTLSNATTGLANGNQALVQAAVQIATPGNTNLTTPLVDTSQALQLTEASAAVVSATEQTLGSLLNVTA